MVFDVEIIEEIQVFKEGCFEDHEFGSFK